MCLPAPFAAAQLDPVASLLPGSSDGVLHELLPDTLTPVFVINHQVFHQGIGGSAMGKVGYDEKRHRAHNLTLVFSDEEFVSVVRGNLSEHLSVVIEGSAQMLLSSCDDHSQLVVKLEYAGDIAFFSQSDLYHLIKCILIRQG